jgi:hypothetical protein
MTQPDDLDEIAANLARMLTSEDSLSLPLGPAQLATVTFVADGPAPDNLIEEVLQDPTMLGRVRAIWRDHAPGDDHRARLQASPYGRALLHHALDTDALAPAPEVTSPTAARVRSLLGSAARRLREALDVAFVPVVAQVGTMRGGDDRATAFRAVFNEYAVEARHTPDEGPELVVYVPLSSFAAGDAHLLVQWDDDSLTVVPLDQQVRDDDGEVALPVADGRTPTHFAIVDGPVPDAPTDFP